MIGVLLVSIVALLLFYSFFWKRRNLPPGPAPLPIIGNLWALYADSPGYAAFEKWQRQFGAVFTVWYGESPVVTVSDYETIRSTMMRNAEKFADRPNADEFMMHFRGGLNQGIFDASGANWAAQRRFTLHVLRDFGMGKGLMEQRILLEVEALHARIENGGQFDMQLEFDRAVGSVISSVLMGERFTEENENEFYEIKAHLNDLVHLLGKPVVLLMLFATWLRHLPVFSHDFKALLAAKDGVLAHCKRHCTTIRQQINYDDETCTSFVEAFLKERRKREQSGDYSFTYVDLHYRACFRDLQLENVLLDMWIAGLETTSNTLAFAVVYLLNHPETITKCQQELDSVVEKTSYVKTDHRNQLHYINATIAEVQRLTNLLVLNITRAATEDTTIAGYNIPKGTLVSPQLSTVLYDEKTFPEPYAFRPERFLDENGAFKKLEEMIPFSVGKRSCVGEGLAQMELFLFIANLLHKFEISATTLPSMEKEINATMKPKPYICIIKKRA